MSTQATSSAEVTSLQTQQLGSLVPGIAFVTGGTRGLGNVVAVSFAKDSAKGVAIVDINWETLTEGKIKVESYRTRYLAIQANVSKEDNIERAVAEAVKEFGRIDYTTNFVVILGSMDQTSELSLEDFQKVMAINCNGIYLSTKHELREMIKQSSIKV